MESFVDASCKLFLDGIDRVLQQVSARYDLDVSEVRREFLLPLIDSRAPSKVAAPKVVAAPKKATIVPEATPSKPKPEGPKCVARSIRGMCTRTATKPGCLCTLHFRLAASAPPVPAVEVPEVPPLPVPEPVPEVPAVPMEEVPEPVPEPEVPPLPVPEPVPEVPLPVPVAAVPVVPAEPEVLMEIDRASSSPSSFDIGDIPEDFIDFDAAFEDAMRIPLPEPEPAKPKKTIPIDLVTSPQPRTIDEILSQKKIEFQKPTDAFLAEYGGITEVDKRTAAAIQSEQSRKIRKIKIKS
jgi:hypothetical protein